MLDLTARQIQILRAIIEEFIETAEPVGSDTIDKKFHIGVSPATIRNEMVVLAEQGYLTKVHSSAGRIPTPMAMKLYINELMKEKELSVADEVSAKEKIWKSRDHLDHLLLESAKVLADKTKSLAMAINEDRMYHAGYANLLKMPEFYDIDVMRDVLTLIEEGSLLDEIFEYGQSQNPVNVVYGAEMGNHHLDTVGVIFMHLGEPSKNQHCTLAIIGSTRFDYRYVMPMMRYFRGMIRDMVPELE